LYARGEDPDVARYVVDRPVRIDEDCWIGVHVAVAPGVRIGRGAAGHCALCDRRGCASPPDQSASSVASARDVGRNEAGSSALFVRWLRRRGARRTAFCIGGRGRLLRDETL
jgi:hypothetical protein